MLYSMTGFGRATKDFGNFSVTVEIKSVNSKTLDLKTRIPVSYREKELVIRSLINDHAERGKVDFVLEVSYPEGSQDFVIDRKVFTNYYHQLSAIATDLKLEPLDLLNTIIRMPEVVSPTEELVSEEEWTKVSEVILSALEAFKKYRESDGSPLEKDFTRRVTLIEDSLKGIEPFEGDRVKKIKDRLVQNLEEWSKKYTDDNRLEQELIYYLERYDISEEKSRLKHHCAYFIEEMNVPEMSKGKKLSFIVQEMGREINTIGSKANSVDIQRLVVVMKDELEKIKEQLANVL